MIAAIFAIILAAGCVGQSGTQTSQDYSAPTESQDIASADESLGQIEGAEDITADEDVSAFAGP